MRKTRGMREGTQGIPPFFLTPPLHNLPPQLRTHAIMCVSIRIPKGCKAFYDWIPYKGFRHAEFSQIPRVNRRSDWAVMEQLFENTSPRE